jgi:hypothetical protein
MTQQGTGADEFKRKAKKPDPDLRLDMVVSRDFVRSVVVKCRERYPDKLVTGILYFYSFSDRFLRAQVFDNPDPIYSCTGDFYSEDLTHTAWTEFYDRCYEADTTVISHDGRMINTQVDFEPVFIKTSSESAFNSADEDESPGCSGLGDVRKEIGRMLSALIKQERNQRLFDQLHSAADWKIMIAEDECDFSEQS